MPNVVAYKATRVDRAASLNWGSFPESPVNPTFEHIRIWSANREIFILSATQYARLSVSVRRELPPVKDHRCLTWVLLSSNALAATTSARLGPFPAVSRVISASLKVALSFSLRTIVVEGIGSSPLSVETICPVLVLSLGSTDSN